MILLAGIWMPFFDFLQDALVEGVQKGILFFC
jgi:hypothetical protein